MRRRPEYKVVVSDRAKMMLGIHVHFLARVSPEAARNTRKEIGKAIRSLAVMPGRFSFDDSVGVPPNKYHKMFVGKWYLILYQIMDTTVFVDYIVDSRQDYGWLLQ